MPSCRSAGGNAKFLPSRLVQAVREARNDERYFTQVSQLSRQGVWRFTGSCRVSTVLGICVSDETYTEARDTSANAEPLGRAEDEQDQFGCAQIGALRSKKVRRLLHDNDGRFAAFCEDCAHAQCLWEEAIAATDVSSVVQKIQDCIAIAKIGIRFHGELIDNKKAKRLCFLLSNKKAILVVHVQGQAPAELASAAVGLLP